MKTITPTIQPLPKQDIAWTKLIDKKTKYILFGGGAGGGKSWLGCEWLMVMCYQYPGTKWYIGRKELKRLMQSSFETFKKVCKYHNIPENDWKLNGQYNYIEFKNGSKIDLLDVDFQPSDPLYERFGSTEYTGGWLEEAGEINFGAFDVLRTRVGRQMNKEYGLKPKILITANPKRNWLKRLIWRPWRDGTLDKNYAYIQSLYSDNYYTADTYGENLKEISDKTTKQRLLHGDWDYDNDDNALVDGNAIADIWTNTIDKGNKYAVIDVARFGKDTTKVYLWNGWNVYKIITWKNQDTATTSTKIKKILSDEQIPYSQAIADEVGVGGGVVDNLRGINGFIANSSPLEDPSSEAIYVIQNGKRVKKHPKENFKSLKDQCGYRVAEMINDHKIGIACDNEKLRELIEEEIAELKDAKPDEDVKKRLVSKDIIKENIGRSPDDLDCILMRYWFELSDQEESDMEIITKDTTNDIFY